MYQVRFPAFVRPSVRPFVSWIEFDSDCNISDVLTPIHLHVLIKRATTLIRELSLQASVGVRLLSPVLLLRAVSSRSLNINTSEPVAPKRILK